MFWMIDVCKFGFKLVQWHRHGCFYSFNLSVNVWFWLVSLHSSPVTQTCWPWRKMLKITTTSYCLGMKLCPMHNSDRHPSRSWEVKQRLWWNHRCNWSSHHTTSFLLLSENAMLHCSVLSIQQKAYFFVYIWWTYIFGGFHLTMLMECVYIVLSNGAT